jgi:hypothetical protein
MPGVTARNVKFPGQPSYSPEQARSASITIQSNKLGLGNRTYYLKCESLGALERLARGGAARSATVAADARHRRCWGAGSRSCACYDSRYFGRASAEKAVLAVDLPQLRWVLPEPLKFATRGPGRAVAFERTAPLEGGWWHRIGQGETAMMAHVQRDNWVALREHAGVLWILPGAAGPRRDGLVAGRRFA